MTTVNGVKDNPQALAAWHAANVFYGDDDPRGRPMSKRSIAAIERKDLVEFRDKWFAPNNAILAVSGDFNDKALKPMLQKTLRRLEEARGAAGDRRAGAAAGGGARRSCRCASSTSRTRRSRACW